MAKAKKWTNLDSLNSKTAAYMAWWVSDHLIAVREAVKKGEDFPDYCYTEDYWLQYFNFPAGSGNFEYKPEQAQEVRE